MNAADSPKVLVLDANQRSALAVVRSLGRRGLAIVTSDETSTALAAHSRYSSGYHRSPSPADAPEDFLRWLGEFVRQHRISYVQPVTEITSQLILRHREALPVSCVLPFAPLTTVMALADKGRLVQLAQNAGVSCPTTRFFERGAELDPVSVSEFPVVLKPRLSRLFLGDRWLSTTVAIVPDRASLENLLAGQPEFRDHPFLLQQFIPGHGAGVFALYNQGKPLVFFAHERLREKPPGGGVSVLSRAVRPDAGALEAARRLLTHVDWHGVAMVEFRVGEDGTPYLMEVNTRFWGSLQLAIDAGVDFPWLLYQLSNGQEVSTPASYRTSQRLRWWLGDLDSLYLFLRDKRNSPTAKLGRVMRFFTPRPWDTRHEIFRWADPVPAWFELKAWFRALRS